MVTNAILLSGRVYDKKDGSGKGLSLNVLINCDNLSSAKVVNLFAGKSYVGAFDLSQYNVLDKLEIDYDQPIGSPYPKLINFSKVVKK